MLRKSTKPLATHLQSMPDIVFQTFCKQRFIWSVLTSHTQMTLED